MQKYAISPQLEIYLIDKSDDQMVVYHGDILSVVDYAKFWDWIVSHQYHINTTDFYDNGEVDGHGQSETKLELMDILYNIENQELEKLVSKFIIENRI